MPSPRWRAAGLLFENCSCQLLCRAHISFKQTCDGERCRGYWAFHLETGHFDHTALDGTGLAVVFDAPAEMYAGGWTQRFYVDAQATPAQREALETIFSGRAGGPWAVLGRFVTRQLDTRVVPMRFEDAGRMKRLTIGSVLETTVTALSGADGAGEAVLSNLHNVIHGPVHTLARGATHHHDPELGAFETDRTHALYSRFEWSDGG